MVKKITKRQAKQIARIMAGILLRNGTREEFMDSNITLEDEDLIYTEYDNRCEIILKEGEFGLANSDEILEYVREHF